MPHELVGPIGLFLLAGCLLWMFAVLSLLQRSNKATLLSIAGFAIGLALMYFFPNAAVIWILGGISAGAGIGGWLDGVAIWPLYDGNPTD